MSNLYYPFIGIAALLIHTIINNEIIRAKSDDLNQTQKIYKHYLNAVFGYYFTDASWGIISLHHCIPLLYIDACFYYMAMALSVVLWCYYVCAYLDLHNFFGRLVKIFGNVFFFVEFIVLCINTFIPLFFTFDENGVFKPLIFRDIAWLTQLVLFAMISIETFIVALKSKGNDRRRHITIFLFSLSMVLSVIGQIVLQLLPLYTFGLMVGTCVIHVFIHEDEKDEFGQKLEKAKQQAEAANAAKTSFLFNMSHDIRTPMNAIIGFTRLLRKYQEDEDKRNNYLDKIQDSSNVLLSIINNVLEMARIEKGTLELSESVWTTEQFVDSLYSVFQEMMEEKEIEFERNIDVIHRYAFCDPIKLREIFINIISNAYKYTKPGGKVSLTIKEIDCDIEGYATYKTTIADTGVGMSKEFLPHIFEEFSREHDSIANKIEGTGLGMPIVKRLVDFMGGKIEVQSQKGVGTVFTVIFTHKIASKNDTVEYAGVELDPSLFKDKRILLAEDNDLNAEIAIEILTETGFIVERAINGLNCLEMYEDAEIGYYDIILMDIQMPIYNGYEATQKIRSMTNHDKANIPILAMTANAFEEDKREAAMSGMNGHVAKPIDIRQLMKELANILG